MDTLAEPRRVSAPRVNTAFAATSDTLAPFSAEVRSWGVGWLPPVLGHLLRVVVVAVLYYAAARLGLLLQLPGTNASPVWPSSGIGLAAVLLFGLRIWPGIALGAFLANLLTLPNTPAGFLASSMIGVGNTLEHLVALLAIRWLVPAPNPFGRARDVFWFVVTASVAGALASANGVSWLWLTGIVPTEMYGRAWFTWWLGDTAGMFVLTPALYYWWRMPRLGLSAPKTLELVVLVALTALTAEVLFGGWIESEVIASLPYLVVPGLLWAAFRFGQRETSSLAVLLSVIAVVHTWAAMGSQANPATAPRTVFGPFLGPTLAANDSLLMLQIFVCAIALTAITLAAAVSEQSEVEKALQQAEARYRDLYEHSPEFYASVNAATACIEQCNATLAQALGMTREEIVGRSVLDLYHPDCLDTVKEAFEQFRVTGIVRNAELQLRRKDGGIIEVILNASAVRDGAGKILRSRSVWRDNTERKRTEAALRESEQRLRLAQQAAHIGTFEWNVDTGVNHWTPELEAMYGLQPGEFGKTQLAWEELLHPDDRAAALRGVESAFATGLPTEGEWRVVWPDHSIHWIAARFQVFTDESGRYQRLAGINIDITARKQAEAEIQQKNRDLETLLYVTSHDLREPLRSVQSFARLVHDRYAAALDDKGKDFLGRILRGADRLDRLLEDIQTLALAHRMAWPAQDVEGTAIVTDVLERLAGKVQETGARIRVADNLPRLQVDRTWVTQAVYNLVANALKFTRPGEPPDVEIAGYEEATVTGPVQGLVVRDRGPGVQPEHAERIFQLFQRAVGREIEGTGAGLAIVRQIAQRHGGNAWVRQRPGGGAEFVITFQVRQHLPSDEE